MTGEGRDPFKIIAAFLRRNKRVYTAIESLEGEGADRFKASILKSQVPVVW